MHFKDKLSNLFLTLYLLKSGAVGMLHELNLEVFALPRHNDFN